jgi:hypothetical protein
LIGDRSIKEEYFGKIQKDRERELNIGQINKEQLKKTKKNSK